MAPPAFAQMTLSPPSPTPSNSSKTPMRRAPTPSPAKRTRPSPLSEKYRRTALSPEETHLIGHPQKPPTSPHHPPPLRLSRFPASWPEVVTQAVTAVSQAVAAGHDRIRVDLHRPDLLPSARPAVHALSTLPDPASHHIQLLVDTACAAVERLLRLDPDHPRNFGLSFRPRYAAIFFNDEKDATHGSMFVPDHLKTMVSIAVLGKPVSKDAANADVAIIIAPCNRVGNPSHIENVEMVHYTSWTRQKIVLMLNPDLVALTSFSSFGDEPRPPCFLSDYLSSYYLHPAAFPTKAAVGAVLRCFPRKWEMYLLKVPNEHGFRLVAEQAAPPSPEKIRCEFSWRVDSDIENPVAL